LFQGSDDDKRRKFAQVAGVLKRRIELFAGLPLSAVDRRALEKKVGDIGLA
jgi:hypothetical protein